MPISINPIFPVIAAQGIAPELVLQPGTVIDAQVLKILANDLVRIAIANLSIEVFSEVPLQIGQTLQLAVSQTPDGIKLAVVGQDGGAGNATVPALRGSEPSMPKAVPPEIVDIAPVAAGKTTPADAEPLEKALTPMQAIAVAAAAQTAATRQNSLAPLFANLGAVTQSEVLPAQLRHAVMQILALRPSLDQNLNAGHIKSAFQASGLFLESSLASARMLPLSAGVPDLKAALLVLRQTLQALDMAAPDVASPPAAAARPLQAAPGMSIDLASGRAVAASPSLAPPLMPEIDVEEVFLPQARLPVAEDFSEPNGTSHIPSAAPPPQTVRTGAATSMPNALQEILQASLQKADRPERAALDESLPPGPLKVPDAPKAAALDDNAAAAHTSLPPPPFRGALPTAQPVAAPSIVAGASLAAIVHRLAEDTDAAIARQTLLQVASLPDSADLSGLRTDPAAPGWNFEIPFSTLAGTAIAQFEIARDGGGSKIDAVKPVWRARFSLDVEPAGPVHASISLAGDRTSVRMWAERPATATQLRAGISRLSEALHRAELQAGDIIVRHGAPSQQATAPAGHFLDREL
jgi:Flagellar hook-length control protein FliK